MRYTVNSFHHSRYRLVKLTRHNFKGPIIRITPSELHINDPEYYDTLYDRSGRRDKYSYFSGRFGYASDLFSTIDHDTHRMRRKALSPMFSVKRISQFQPVIREKTEKFCQRLEEFAKDGRILPLHNAMMALSTDIISEYAFARAYNQLDAPNFEETLHEALTTIYVTGQFALHFPIVFPILDLLPDWFVIKVQPVLQPVVGLRRV
jgi:cytochrome P450